MSSAKHPGVLYLAVVVALLATTSYIRSFSPCAIAQTSPSAETRPPVAPVRPVVDDYFGTRVADPYRYMENVDDPEVLSWMKAQNDYTRTHLAKIPGRPRLLARIHKLDESVPQVEAERLPGDTYLLRKILPGENTRKLYLRHGLRGDDTLLVDPEKIALARSDQGRGKNVIAGLKVSPNGQYVAVNVVPGGDELHGELRVIDINSGQEQGDVLTRIGAEAWEANWLPDGHSFAYGRLQELPPGAPAAEVRQKFRSYLHVLGTKAEADKPLFGFGVVPSISVDPSLIASVHTQPASHWALGVLNGSVTPNSAYYIEDVADLGKQNNWRKIADFADDVTEIAIHDDDLFLLTYKDAPRYKLLRMNARKADLSSAEVLLPPSEAVVTSLHPAQDGLYVRMLDGGVTRVVRIPYGANPEPEPISLPFAGSAFVGTDPRLPGAFLYVTSWTRAFKIYSYDPQTKQAHDTQLQPAGPHDDPDNVEAKEVKVPGHDGVMIPLSIAYPKNTKMDGRNPTLLEGYGAYGWSFPPYFEPTRLAWHELGGIYAVCHVRGGGEYGEEWHLAGKEATKPNTWRDFIACARYLIDNKYTSAAYLAGEGVSAGGVLIGRTLTSEPELFRAVIDKVGMSDTLRSELTQNGETNIPEFGTARTKSGFQSLYEMSAYDHVKDGTAYPAVLFETGINDPRVDPWEMAKMTARVQAANASSNPILLRVDFAGGHGAMGATRDQADEQLADEWSFLLWQFKVAEFEPK
ncbi:MAG: S9 family peptidase [Acidobacteria bacterium]|nr:S9 family peptidase [Acidobacteriota bacterium]